MNSSQAAEVSSLRLPLRTNRVARALRIRELPAVNSWEKIATVVTLVALQGAILPLIREQELGPLDPIEGDPLGQLILSGIYLGIVFLVARKPTAVISSALTNWPLILFVFLAPLSLLWSGEPDVTIRRSLALLGTTMVGFYLAGRYGVKELLDLLAYAFGITLILSLAFVIFAPDLGTFSEARGSSWRGVFNHKNVLGKVAAFGIVIFLLRSIQRKVRGKVLNLGMAAIAALLLVRSFSVTGIVAGTAVIVFIAFILVLRWRERLNIFGFSMAAVLLVLVSLWTIQTLPTLLDLVGRDFTLTRRTLLWETVISAANKHEYFGYGFSAFWLGWSGPSAAIWLQIGWRPPHAHNGILDLWLDLGLFGVAFFVLLFVRDVGRALKLGLRQVPTHALFPIVYLSFLVVYNVTESTILRQNSIFWTLYVAVSTLLVKRNLARHEHGKAYEINSLGV